MSDTTPERIRFCLGCGEAMPFEARICAACQHENPPVPGSAPADDGRPQEACPHCAHEFVASGVFCPSCGRERRAPQVGAAPRVPDEPPGARGLQRTAWALTLLGPVVVALAVATSWWLAR